MLSRSRVSKFIWALLAGWLAACASTTAPTPTEMPTSMPTATHTLTPSPTTTPTPVPVATSTPHLPGLQPGWTTYAPAQDIIAQTRVRSLVIAPSGELWLGTDEGPYRFDGQSWEKFTQGLSSAYVHSLAVGPAGDIWAGTEDGVARFTGQSWQRLTVKPTWSHKTFNDITVSPTGDLWFAMSPYTAKFDGEDWYEESRPLGHQAHYDYTPINALAITAAGDTWLGTPQGVFYQKERPETLAVYTTADGLAHDAVEAIVETADGALWFGTHGGVSRYDGQAWTTYTEQDGLVGQTVFDIATGPDGALWFLTERAVCRTMPETPVIAQAVPAVAFTPIPTYTPTPIPTPLPAPFRNLGSVFDVFFLGDSPHLINACDGTAWLITDQAAARLDDAAPSETGLEPTVAHLPGSVVGIDAQGRVWAVSEDYSETAAWDGDAWSVYGPEEGWTPLAEPDYRYAHDASCDPSGRFWLATSQDVRAFDGERWSVFTPADMEMDDNLPEAEYYSIFRVTVQQSTGDVWVGVCDYMPPGPYGGRGARRFDGTTWHGADSPATGGCVEAIETYAGDVWLGVDGVLWQYTPDSGAWAEFALPDPEPHRGHGSITDLVVDPFGRFWVTALRCGGASCLSRAYYYLQNGVWHQMLDEEFLIVPLQAVATDASGTSWLFSDVIYRLDNENVVPDLELLASSVVEDPTGRVWFLVSEDPQVLLMVIGQ